MAQREDPQKKPVSADSELNDDLNLLHLASPSVPPIVLLLHEGGIPTSSTKSYTNNPPRATGPVLVLYPYLSDSQKCAVSLPQGTQFSLGWGGGGDSASGRAISLELSSTGLDDQGQHRGFVYVHSVFFTSHLYNWEKS